MIASLFSYSLASGTILIVLMTVYMLLLRNTTHFEFNRGCLIGILLASFVLPFVPFDIFLSKGIGAMLPATVDPLAPGTAVAADSPSVSLIDWQVIGVVYAAGCGVMAVRMLANVCFILYLLICSRRLTVAGRMIRVHNHRKIQPFSWGGNIFVAQDVMYEDPAIVDMIVCHEAAHSDNRHWLDLIASNIALMINWYNPAAWLLQGELMAVHEYEADRVAARESVDKVQYQLLLIKKTAGVRFHAFADSLNHSSLKNRITMMMRNQSKKSARLRSLALLPAVAVALCVSNSSCVKNAQEQVSEPVAEPVESEIVETETVATEVETPEESSVKTYTTGEATMPEYPGGEGEFYNALAKEITWRDGLAEGRVVIQFVVDTDGSMTDFKVLKGVSPETDKYALECVKKIKTKWIPGKNADGQAVKVSYVVPVSFKTE